MTRRAEEPRAVLVRSPNWLGDAVLSMPAVEAIRRLYPEATIGVLSPEGLAPLWAMQPMVDTVEAFGPTRGLARLWDDLRLAGRIRKERWELSVAFPNSFRSALLPAMAGVSRRVGFATDARRWLLTDRPSKTEELRADHQMDQYLRLIRDLGYDGPKPLVRLTVEPERLQWADALLNRQQPTGGRRPVVGIHPGATYGPAKRWFPERFAALAEAVANELGALVLVCGGSGEAPWAEDAAAARPGQLLDWTGRTDVAALAALLARCDVVVCNDSGPMHVAAAVGTPVVALFGSSDPARTGPVGPGHVVVREHVECSPCFARTCPLPGSKYVCFEPIGVERVLEAVAERLDVSYAESSQPL
ncbi:MAG: lipopolysaccharide heptosyltransferase II [bacterium]|nr:lipopolysaccharide heptosyltransferase II [bacterium]